jgi:hypothetical protein
VNAEKGEAKSASCQSGFPFSGLLTLHATMFVPNTLSFSKKPEKSVERRNQRRGANLALGQAVQGVYHLSELAHIPRARPA